MIRERVFLWRLWPCKRCHRAYFLDPNTPRKLVERSGTPHSLSSLSTGIGLQLPEKAIGTITGLSTKVTVVFAESLHQSDRACSTKVTVDKLPYPKGL
jgi:hypothetical protein